MIRAYAYIAAASVIWLVEGGLFSHFLDFAAWQVVLLGMIYLAILVTAVRALLHSLAEPPEGDGVAAWRVVSLAPMIVVVLGSFVSLPLVVVVALLGRL